MPTELPLDSLDRVSFGGIQIPTLTYTFRASSRTRTHSYRKVKGGRNEKQGRGLYESKVSAVFHQSGERKGNPAWPDNLFALRDMFDRDESAVLVLPTIGNVKATIIDFESTFSAKVRSGEDASITFLEDEDNDFERVLSLDDFRDLAGKTAKLDEVASRLSPRQSVFDQINGAVNQVLAYRDQFQLYGSLIASKIQNLVLLLEEIDRTLTILNDPANWEVIDAMQDVWLAAQNLIDSPGTETISTRVYVVTRKSTVAEVASAIYNDSSRARDLLGLNFFEDALAIPPSTQVLYIPD